MTVTKILEQTLSVGSTSVSFTDTDIPNSLIRVFSSNSDLIPVSRILSGNTLTVTYEAQTNAIDVAVEIVKAGLDIVDDLTSTDTDKALSAKQGNILKGLIDNIELTASNVDITPITGITSDNVQGALEEVFQSVSDGKILIADAITDKGVPTSADDTFSTMAENIESISGGGSSAHFLVRGVYGSGTTNYTIPRTGYYLLIAGNTYNGSRSINLPTGRTALIENNVYTDTRGVKWCVVYLEENDVVTLTTSHSSWLGDNRFIIELLNFNSESPTITNTLKQNDGTCTKPTLEDDSLYLVIGYAVYNTASPNNSSLSIPAGYITPYSYQYYNQGIGARVYICCDCGKNIGNFSIYGYDGGISTISVIKL